MKSAVDWLIDGARSAATPQEVMTTLCERLSERGLPLWRPVVFVRTLHPQVVGRRFAWRPESGTIASEAPFELLDRDAFRNSPMSHVNNSGRALRRRLVDADCPMDFPILLELREEGVTDYVISPLRFTNDEIHFASWAMRQTAGFTVTDIATIESVVAPLARVAEIRAARRVASNLLATYVGNKAAERILAGQIRRGSADAIHAAIWLSDMRGFTKLADRLPPHTLLDLLISYFDCQIPPILERGGEVLKFMGDGLLGIFPIGDGADSAKVSAAALAAAYDTRAHVAGLSVTTSERVRFGLALHVGDVLYGNIGSSNRLDFSCIGPAVNLAARHEKLTGQLGRTILASQEFAGHCGDDLMPIGSYAVAGLAEAQIIFGVREKAERVT
jgi:adenylate cyclase